MVPAVSVVFTVPALLGLEVDELGAVQLHSFAYTNALT